MVQCNIEMHSLHLMHVVVAVVAAVRKMWSRITSPAKNIAKEMLKSANSNILFCYSEKVSTPHADV